MNFVRLALVSGTILPAACVTYHPAPLDPVAGAAAYSARSVTDSGFRAFRMSVGLPASAGAWHPIDLALAALYFRSTLDEARANLMIAHAAERTAGARLRPGLSGTVERNLGRSGEDSPWGVQLLPTVTVETGGKRGARIAIARARALAAEATLRELAWSTVRDAREAAVLSVNARSRSTLARSIAQRLDSLIPLVEARYRDGAIGQAELSRVVAEAQSSRFEAVELETVWHRTVSEAAALTGLAPGAIVAVEDSSPPPAECSPLLQLTADSLHLLALSSRWSVAEALAGYQLAEGELRLEIARQRPDLELGPGLFFDHGITRFLVNFALPFLPGGNRGPIAEAESRRLAAAAHLATVQEEVLLAVDRSAAQCGNLATALTAARQLGLAAETRVRQAREAYQRGELPRLDVARTELEVLRGIRAESEVLQRLREAGAGLESAAGVWFVDGPPRWPDVLIQPPRVRSREQP